MKRFFKMTLVLVVWLSFFAACGSMEQQSVSPSEPEIIQEMPQTEEPENAVITYRVVSVQEGTLLLAEAGGQENAVYALSAEDMPVMDTEGKPQCVDALKPGALIDVLYSGDILETFPARLPEPAGIVLKPGAFDDRCALYLQVLEDLWEVDSALNESITYLGVDLSETSLSPAEQTAVAWAFAGRHGAELVQDSLDGLRERGYITAEPIFDPEDSGGEPTAYFYHWKDGCLFSVEEKEMEGTYSLVPVTFDVMKWRSSLGAYVFSDCKAVQSALGQWSEYTVGSEMIS